MDNTDQLIVRTLTRLNAAISRNFVHTFQFVSIPKPHINRFVWRTVSMELPKYQKATLNFLGFDKQTKSITRTLVGNEYDDRPFSYALLGSKTIFEPGHKQYMTSEISENEVLATTAATADTDSLLSNWHQCLGSAFDDRGSTMWVSQAHVGLDSVPVVTSVFVVFNDDIGDENVRYRASKLIRDFIVDYLVLIFTEEIRSQITLVDRTYDPSSYFSSRLEARLAELDRVIRSAQPILLTGETGTGKMVVAKRIHEMRGLQNIFGAPTPDCIRVGCGKFLEEPQTPIFAQMSNWPLGSTVVFDDVHLLSFHRQVGLREFVESHLKGPIIEIDPNKRLRLLFTATNYFHELVANGTFLDDLYYRISAFRITLPTLRSRKAEMAAIVQPMMDDINARHGYSGSVKSISDDGIQALGDYDYPGNYRELRNILLRAYYACSEGESIITRRHVTF